MKLLGETRLPSKMGAPEGPKKDVTVWCTLLDVDAEEVRERDRGGTETARREREGNAVRDCEPRRTRRDRGMLLSPFDPLLWDRARVRRFFGFDQVIEIFKPAARRTYGYYCLPVLAGERLVASST